MTEITTKTRTKSLPTMSCSISISINDFFLKAVARIRIQMSIVKMVDAELKMEVKEDMRAAIITANIMPRRPVCENQRNINRYT